MYKFESSAVITFWKDLLLGNAQARGAHAIDLNVQGRVIRFLRDEALRNLRQTIYPFLKLFGRSY